MLKRLLALFLSALAAVSVAFCAAPLAGAAAVTNYFQGAYDYRGETPYSCYGQTCWYIPKTDSASYFNAPTLTSVYVRDSIDGRINSDRYAPAVNQNLGVMCWKASTSTGAIWLTTDSRHLDDEGNSALWIGWLPDADVLLSRADRLAYVPECGYFKT